MFSLSFSAAIAMGLCGKPIRLWPIYWSGTGSWEDPLNHKWCAVVTAFATVVIARWHSVYKEVIAAGSRIQLLIPLYFFALCLANLDLRPIVQVHGLVSILINLFTVLSVVSSVKPSSRFPVATYYAVLFVTELMMRVIAPSDYDEYLVGAHRLMMNI